MRRLRKGSGSSSPLFLLFIALPLVASPTSSAFVTFDKDIAPLVFEHCASCHHPGGSGPFPLLTYAEVSRQAAQIVTVTSRRYMPPWPPQHGYGDFLGDRSLTDSQIRLFSDWLHARKPEGNPSDLPPAPRFPSDWQLGPPDLILKMPNSFEMPAGGTDVFRNFIVPSGLTQTKFVRALELRLSNPRVVHHANVILDRTQSLRIRDGEDGKPGFPGMDVITEAAPDSFDPDSHFLFWKPATVLRKEPADMSWRLDPGTDLVVNLHLQPTGKSELVQAEVGLYFSPTPPTRFPMLIQLEHDGALYIPPGSKDFFVSDSLILPVDVEVLAIYPHAHYLGKTIDAWADLPDGTKRPLIRIPDWDINWQAEYEYRKPVFLPKGTRVEMRITYDNSSQNPRNPNRPPKLVVTGERSQDEMGHVWLQVLPKASNDRLVLQEAIMRRRLEKYPADFVAHFNLAALEQASGQIDQAAAGYREALRVEPQNPAARNGLATVLMLEDHLPEAIEELRATLAQHPAYLNAHYNLARALAASGDLAESASQYRFFLAQRPEDGPAQAGLGTILFKQHQIPQALDCFRKAAQADPGDADIQANLGTLLAITGDQAGAAQAFETALRIDPDHAAAKANLARLRSQH